MSCNCKTVKTGQDIDNEIIKHMSYQKLSFLKKMIVIYNFIEFYFYFVTTSVINFIITDKLEPSIPKRLLKRYKKQ